MIWDVHPGSIFFPSRISDPRSRGRKSTGSGSATQVFCRKFFKLLCHFAVCLAFIYRVAGQIRFCTASPRFYHFHDKIVFAIPLCEFLYVEPRNSSRPEVKGAKVFRASLNICWLAWIFSVQGQWTEETSCGCGELWDKPWPAGVGIPASLPRLQQEIQPALWM